MLLFFVSGLQLKLCDFSQRTEEGFTQHILYLKHQDSDIFIFTQNYFFQQCSFLIPHWKFIKLLNVCYFLSQSTHNRDRFANCIGDCCLLCYRFVHWLNHLPTFRYVTAVTKLGWKFLGFLLSFMCNWFFIFQQEFYIQKLCMVCEVHIMVLICIFLMMTLSEANWPLQLLFCTQSIQVLSLFCLFCTNNV